MLRHLYIANFAIVDQLDLDMSTGLTVITGETGAGKSIMIDALNLALGARADSASVRAGADRAEVVASFDLADNRAATQWLNTHELQSGSECILRRTLSSQGGSRAFINGTPATLTQLRELASLLIHIYGQHEHQALLQRDTHRAQTDTYGRLGKQAAEVADSFAKWRDLSTRLEAWRTSARERQDRVDLLRFQLAELEQLTPLVDEFQGIEQAHRRAAATEHLLASGQAILTALDDDDSLPDHARRLEQRARQLAKTDATASSIVDLIENAAIQLEEAASELRHYCESLELDPEAYSALDQRLGQYVQLARKHHCSPEELAGLHTDMRAELAQLDDGDDKAEALTSAVQSAQEVFENSAQVLSKGRLQIAKKLGKVITESLQPLGMEGARFEVAVEPLALDQATAHGLDRIEFKVSTNPGQPMRPLAKVASGGELSRISLAIQVACAQDSTIRCMIFDEVDVGIGGRVGLTVGKLLRTLGAQHQVLCVTHLAQVAAQGHHHFYVDKETRRGKTSSHIRCLTDAERETEVARMLGGLETSEQSRAHARELMDEPA